MFVVTEAEAAAIRVIFNQQGELSAAVELRRLFPAIMDNVQARECARVIACWQPLPPPAQAAAPEASPGALNKRSGLRTRLTEEMERLHPGGCGVHVALGAAIAACMHSIADKTAAAAVINDTLAGRDRTGSSYRMTEATIGFGRDGGLLLTLFGAPHRPRPPRARTRNSHRGWSFLGWFREIVGPLYDLSLRARSQQARTVQPKCLYWCNCNEFWKKGMWILPPSIGRRLTTGMVQLWLGQGEGIAQRSPPTPRNDTTSMAQ